MSGAQTHTHARAHTHTLLANSGLDFTLQCHTSHRIFEEQYLYQDSIGIGNSDNLGFTGALRASFLTSSTFIGR